MFKRLGLGIVLVTIVLGIIFIGLNILDIEEGFRLHLPIPILNTVFISAVAALVAYIAARSFTIDASPGLLGLGSAALAFGVGNLLRGWLVGIGLNVPITVHDSAALIASVLHLVGASLSMAGLGLAKLKIRQKQSIILLYYLGVLASIALVTVLAFQGVIPPFSVPGERTPLLRDVARGTAATFFIASSFIYLRIYSKWRIDFYYWYSLGLMLFSSGIVFMSQGAVESLIGWLGRGSQYAAGMYFLVSVLGVYKLENYWKTWD